MSLPSSANPTGDVVQKQTTNVYTVMLILSFLFILIACIMLWLELQRFGELPYWDTSGVRSAGLSLVPTRWLA